ncbi:YeiH family protein [Fundidesulfovibrio agrisoli]|uniref:YeiH family protein n=1 Tax=Fundidesulfovibrio agrisoli TaxID=2922717 RepID=UPI001FAD68B7|nr:putative sulfate exporter family transporter [Fundidesulfovibrio agrisoli]
MEERGFLGKLAAIVPGLAMMVVTLYLLKQVVEPWLAGVAVFGQKGYITKSIGLNYVLMSILVGMAYRNLLFRGSIPGWAAEGFRTTRLFIKTGVIMLGSLYTIQSLAKVGGLAIALIVAFVFGTIFFVMWMGKKLGMDRSMVGVMGAACGVCGVSAAIATSPGVKAKPAEVALAIATILGFGIMSMFITPPIGRALGLSDYQFGAWVGTGILNSGQVLATCLSFNPAIAPGTAVAYGEIWNVVRVISIPFVVFFITLWYWRGEAQEEHMSLWGILKSKFPIFVLGFFGMTALSSFDMLGKEGSETLHMLRDWMAWIFGIGMVGLGAYIDFGEIKKAGGAPLKIGVAAGTLKLVLSLVIILLFIGKEASF